MSEKKRKLAKCPHCKKEIRLKKYARFAGEGHIKTSIVSSKKNVPLPAKLLGDHINFMQKLLKEVGKELGGKVEVFIEVKPKPPKEKENAKPKS